MFFTLLIILIALIGLLLGVVVLLQSGQGGGLAGIASGGATRQVLGARQAPDLLERATWTLASIFIVLCILTNFAIPESEQESVLDQVPTEQPQQQAPALPPAEGGQQQGQQQAPPAGTQQQGGAGQPAPPPAGTQQEGTGGQAAPPPASQGGGQSDQSGGQ